MATRKEYSSEFKAQAVKLVLQNGNRSHTARELDITPGMLLRWQQELAINGERAGNQPC